jgi:hypothetical protein
MSASPTLRRDTRDCFLPPRIPAPILMMRHDADPTATHASISRLHHLMQHPKVTVILVGNGHP